MTDLKQLSKKLRNIADSIDELFEVKPTRKIAEKIIKTLKRKKLHWTQKPENKAKLRMIGKKRWQNK